MYITIEEVDGVQAQIFEAFEIAGITGIVDFDTIAAALAEADDSVSFNDQAITDVADPTDGQDVATKAYVDANSGGGGGVRVEMDTSASLSAGIRDACYTNTGAAGTVVATLPTSAAIGSSRWRARFVVMTGQIFRFLRQGSDSISFYGNAGASLESSTVLDIIDIEYAGGGLFVVTGNVGQGWSLP